MPCLKNPFLPNGTYLKFSILCFLMYHMKSCIFVNHIIINKNYRLN